MVSTLDQRSYVGHWLHPCLSNFFPFFISTSLPPFCIMYCKIPLEIFHKNPHIYKLKSKQVSLYLILLHLAFCLNKFLFGMRSNDHLYVFVEKIVYWNAMLFSLNSALVRCLSLWSSPISKLCSNHI